MQPDVKPDVYSKRGVVYFDGRVRCPLAGVGSRGPNHSNRLALENDDSVVTIDRVARLITVENPRTYTDKTLLADLTFLADAKTKSGALSPIALHLEIFRKGDALSLDFHRHLRNQEPLVDADVEPFDVVVRGGKRPAEIVYSPARALALVRAPSLAYLIVKAIMDKRDHVAGLRQDPRQPGYRIADLSLGFGALGFSHHVVRAVLRSLSGENAELIERATIAEMLAEGTFELSLTALSRKWLPSVLKRDLFLFGIEDIPLLAPVRERGLEMGETLAFRFSKGEGEIALGSRTAPLPSALDVARAYLEFHTLGGLLCEHAERGAAKQK